MYQSAYVYKSGVDLPANDSHCVPAPNLSQGQFGYRLFIWRINPDDLLNILVENVQPHKQS